MPTTPEAPPPGLLSVVVTVRNEGRNIAALLDSLLVQEPPFEILIVDSNSQDDTVAVAQRYATLHPELRVLVHGGTRGESRNWGVQQARGEAVVFIDGDCVASGGWLAALRRQLRHTEVAAGETQQVGWAPFENLERVELRHKGYDVTLPSCNLAYRRDVFLALGGFDPWFRTAEDIDLNYRAVDRGYHLAFVHDAVVFHKTRSTVFKFLKQALWNGYGRKQLTLKHGPLWERYKLRRMLQTQRGFWAFARLGVALLGYILAKIREDAETHAMASEHRTAPPEGAGPPSQPSAPPKAGLRR